MKEDLACPYAGSADVVGRYLAGTLPDSEVFEEHWFACDRCWSEVRRGMEVREVLSDRGGRLDAASSHSTWWKPLVGVAAALVLAAGLWLASRPKTPEASAFRGSGSPAISLEVRRTASGLTLRWPAQQDADAYRVELFAPDGVLLSHQESRDLQASIDGSSLPATWQKQDFFARVQALDRLRQIVADSKLVRTAPAPGS
ncbi:MAG: hypothetical protein M3167_14615 [Acidobacteriota bacterium]|nr:hypothetical protein [Acidobacteriota bacterium]